jgi:acetyl-CoA/propionyl-CoA carboxylase carboxyl transferase subunit
MTITEQRPATGIERVVGARNPRTRLSALCDDDTFEPITPEDDRSGVLAGVGRINGCRVVAFCSDATVQGGAMGTEGCRHIVEA